jgi:DNA-binding CsgD family transcriptional regulator
MTGGVRHSERRFKPIDVVEAAYSLEHDDRDWLRSIARAARLDFGLGCNAYIYRRTDEPVEGVTPGLEGVTPGFAVPTLDFWNTPPAYEHFSRSMMQFVPADVPHRIHAAGVAMSSVSETQNLAGLTNNEHAPSLLRVMSRTVRATGVADGLGIFAQSQTGCGLAIMGLADRPVSSRPSERRLWQRLAPHLGAGLRLRRLAQCPGLDDEDVDAVFDPRGRCHDARGAAATASARETLREAALRIDRARSHKSRHCAEEALDLWQDLVAGRWSLVDHFDSDGRRFVVARRNDPQFTDPRHLTARERQVARLAARGLTNKLIGFTLCISAAAVSLHLSSALRKLRLSSAAQLRAVDPSALDATEQRQVRPKVPVE